MKFDQATMMDHQLFLPALATFVILVITSLFFLVYRRLRTKADTILFVGLAGSGKTAMFTKLVNPKNKWTSFMSLKENRFAGYGTKGGKCFVLLDYPGSECFKKTLFQKWFDRNRKSLKCVIFTLDSASFNKKDVAEFLYDVLYELKGKVPVLVACNKQDIGHAKSCLLVKKSLEQEFGLINISREAALSTTDGDSKKRTLTSTGKDFSWNDLTGCNLKFTECSTEPNENFSLASVKEWIDDKL